VRATMTRMTATIDVLIFDGVDELDALGPYEVFANAGLDVALVHLDGPRDVTGAHGVRFHATAALRGAAVVLVPGGGWNDRAVAGAWAQAQRDGLPAAIAAAHARGALVAAVCTGTMIVEAAGVLEGRAAVTHAGAIGELRERGVDVRADARVVDAGDVITCGGVTSGLDLALHLVDRLCGADTAAAVARELEHDRRGTVILAHAQSPAA
jgi:transcriptional regulator GlxA family with amidase domain